ncbi:MAG: hypothetical protein ABSE83_00005 [Methanobacterium sp.]
MPLDCRSLVLLFDLLIVPVELFLIAMEILALLVLLEINFSMIIHQHHTRN